MSILAVVVDIGNSATVFEPLLHLQFHLSFATSATSHNMNNLNNHSSALLLYHYIIFTIKEIIVYH